MVHVNETIVIKSSSPKMAEWVKKLKAHKAEQREYEASKMAYRDIKNSVDTAKREGIAEGMEIGLEKGMKQGMEKGMKEGMEKGMSQRSLEIAKKMLAKGMDEASIMDMTGLTVEETKMLKAEM